MLNRVTGVLFIALGIVSMVDGWRITEQARPTGNFDAIGPDRYMMGLGALMLLAGLWRLLSRQEAQPGARGATDSDGLPILASTLGLFAAFAFAVPFLGFSLACFLFLAAQLWVLSGWAWWKAVAVAVPLAIAFHAAFVTFADMPFPKGVLEGYFGV
jgi:hypothetical protein